MCAVVKVEANFDGLALVAALLMGPLVYPTVHYFFGEGELLCWTPWRPTRLSRQG